MVWVAANPYLTLTLSPTLTLTLTLAKVEPRAGPRPPKRALHSAVEVQGLGYR